MHNDDIERASDREDAARATVNAADDTGLVAQQEILIHAELGAEGAGAEEGVE